MCVFVFFFPHHAPIPFHNLININRAAKPRVDRVGRPASVPALGYIPPPPRPKPQPAGSSSSSKTHPSSSPPARDRRTRWCCHTVSAAPMSPSTRRSRPATSAPPCPGTSICRAAPCWPCAHSRALRCGFSSPAQPPLTA